MYASLYLVLLVTLLLYVVLRGSVRVGMDLDASLSSRS